ncbi:hypothetical protein ACFQ07_29025, partial [Actinomadura adrarensis]
MSRTERIRYDQFPQHHLWLTDIAGVSATEAWAIGDEARYGNDVVLRWDGRTWSLVPGPDGGWDGWTTRSVTARGP